LMIYYEYEYEYVAREWCWRASSRVVAGKLSLTG
jgi:hypothetical protein